MCIATPLGWCKGEPDFMNPDAVLKGMRSMLDECSNAKCKNCMVKCGYGLKTLKNFLKANPQGDPGILKQRWQPCFEAHRDADIQASPSTDEKEAPKAKPEKAEAATTYDRSKFVVSKLQLGGDMNAHKDRLHLLKAYGYFKKANNEYSGIVLSRGKSSPGPDVIRNYEGSIREAPVYIFFEATSDGRIYKIKFEQKENMEVESVKEALIERYGKPSKHHGNYLYWGCDRGPQEGFCVKANVSTRSLTIWAFDEDIKKTAYTAYNTC